MQDRGAKLNQRGNSQDRVGVGRHEHRCTICAHPLRDDIEQAFVNWVSTKRTAKAYGISRDAIYRHAHALGLLDRRRRNVRAALEHIIEHAGEVEVNAAAVVGAVSAYARINSRGEWVERKETVSLDTLFERMSIEELEVYAKEGKLPDWFNQLATAGESERGSHGR